MSRNLGEDRALFLTLPPNMQDEDTEAFSYAVDRQIAKLLPLAAKLNVWGNLDGVDPKFYDLLAVTINAPSYRSEYSDEQKQKLIKTALQTYYKLGTRGAVEEVLNSLYEKSGYVPWWEYGGAPYHFKIRADDQRTFNVEQIFIRLLRKVKAAREIMDSMETYRTAEQTLYLAATQIFTHVIRVKDAAAKPVKAKSTYYISSIQSLTYHIKDHT